MYALAHTSPGAGNPGFSTIIEGPSGPGSAPKRRAGAACHGSAAIRRQAYAFRGAISAPAAACRASVSVSGNWRKEPPRIFADPVEAS